MDGLDSSTTAFMSQTLSSILLEVSLIEDFSLKSARLDFYVDLLEEEMRKIQVSQHALPQCMCFVQNAIERLKEESLKWKAKQAGPVLKELFPLKSHSTANGWAEKSFEHPNEEKMSWLNSVRISTKPSHKDQIQADLVLHPGETELGNKDPIKIGLLQRCHFNHKQGAFVPFNTKAMVEGMEKQNLVVDGMLEGSEKQYFVVDGMLEESEKQIYSHSMERNDDEPQRHTLHQQQLKKQRRCWSLELHKRFLDAVQQLGGPKFATPKRVSGLMKVDGLTIDEAKSHLQKYRMYIRRLASSSTGQSKFSWLNDCALLTSAMGGYWNSQQGD